MSSDSPGTVLVSGASIAGPTLAWWLQRHGFAPTVVERFDALREEGQNVDVRGAGREVLRRMGLEEGALAHTTGEQGTCFVDDDGRRVATFPAATGQTDGATAELEILRGRLSRLVVDSSGTVGTGVEYLFGDQVADLIDDGDGVRVTFASGAERTFDLVVVAEGVGSRTRAKVFDGDPRRPLGIYCAYLTVPRTAADDDTWRWYAALGGRSVHLRPDDAGTTRALLSFMSDTRGLADLDAAAQVSVLRSVFANAGWETPRVLAALDDADPTRFYFEDLAQVHAPTWSRGRVALTGDSAWCATPISGMGTTLSVVGAYVLAGELAVTGTGGFRQAFARYEERMRPFVAKAQSLPPGTPWVANPRSRLHRSVLWAGMRAVASPVGRALGGVAGRYVAPPADSFTVPDYPTPPQP